MQRSCLSDLSIPTLAIAVGRKSRAQKRFTLIAVARDVAAPLSLCLMQSWPFALPLDAPRTIHNESSRTENLGRDCSPRSSVRCLLFWSAWPPTALGNPTLDVDEYTLEQRSQVDQQFHGFLDANLAGHEGYWEAWLASGDTDTYFSIFFTT